jgi:hypothetical protein
MKSLCGLYIKRGYPQDDVYRWLRANITERWNKRLNEERRSADEVLVLKSSFNTAWNYFNAHELGETVLGYWREYITRAESGDFTPDFPAYSTSCGSLETMPEAIASTVWTSEGQALMPDIRKIGILHRRTIVSRKRTRNLFDLTSLWKKTVLLQLEQDVLEPERNLPREGPIAKPRVDPQDDDVVFSNIPDRELSDLERVSLTSSAFSNWFA